MITQEMLERSAGLLESVEDFGVRGEIIHVRPDRRHALRA